MEPLNTSEKAYRLFASKGLAVSLFLLLSVILIPGTVLEKEVRHLSWPGTVVLGLMGLNLLLCSAQRMKTMSRQVLVMHLGILLVMGGAVVSSFGYVATVNIYEGTSVDSAYRWDMEQEMPLGVDLTVRRIHKEYYPVGVKVGVLRGREKVALQQLKTGEAFRMDRYTVRADYLEMPAENLRLTIREGDRMIGTVDTEGQRSLPPDFPYDFVLVAYRNPSVKRVRVDLLISKHDAVMAEGTTEANSPLTWGKISYYNTLVDADPYGSQYAGIQIRYDPGRPYVFAGFGITGVGSVMHLLRRRRGQKDR